MPPVRGSDRQRSKEQTWKESELKDTLKEINGEKSRGDERSHRSRNADDSSKERSSRHGEKSSDRPTGDNERKRRSDVKDKNGHRDKDRGSHREDGDRKNDKDDRKDGHDKHRNDREKRGDDRDKHRDDRDRHRDRDDRDRHRDRDDRDRHRDRDDKEKHRDRDDRDRYRSDKEGHRNDRERRKDNRDRHKDDGGKHREDKDRHRDDTDRHKGDRDRHRDRDDREKHKDRDERDRQRGDKERHRDDRDRHKDDRDRHKDDRDRHKDDRDRHRDDRDRYKDDRDRHRDRDDKERPRDDRERHRNDKEKHRDDRDRHKDDRDKHRDDKDRHRDDKDRHRDDREKHRDDRGRHRDDKDRHRDDRDRHRDRGDKERDRDKDRNVRSGEHRDKGRTRSDHRDDEERQKDQKRHGRDESSGDGKSNDRRRENKHGGRGDPGTDGDGRNRRGQDEGAGAPSGMRSAGRKTGGSQEEDDNEDIVEEQVGETRTAKTDDKKGGNDDEEDYGGYDDDFEDYDDDFEDDDGGNEDDDNNEGHEEFNRMTRKKETNSEMEELFDALNKENDRLLAESRKSNWSDSTDASGEKHQSPVSKRPVTSKPRSFINFVAAKQRDMNQKVASKARKRCNELLKIIDLDIVHLSLFDLPPVNEYSLYMSSFGRTNAQQVAIQTNDDNLERDTQTEEIDSTDKWSQHPPETSVACGCGDTSDSGQDQDDSRRLDESRLTSFLQKTCQVVERLIEEEHAKSVYSESGSRFSCSEAFITLAPTEVFDSRQVIGSTYSGSDANMLLTMYSKPNKIIDKKLDKYGMIAVWNTNDPHQPQKIVASASIPTCCCFSPVKATLVFAGMGDGSLVAWDLREPPTMHHSYICGGKDWLLRFPTYNTAGVLKYENHNSPISAIVPIMADNSKSSTYDSRSGLSFQLATLDRNGFVHLWVVTEMLETSQAGSESDLGLSPNGKIKLLKSSSIRLENPVKSSVDSAICSLDLKLNPTNPNHFYVATDGGLVLHGTRFGRQKITPRCYRSDDFTPCAVTSVDIHPFGHPVMLVGFENGVLRLYQLTSDTPVLTWETSTQGAAIRRVLWSRSCTYIIFVLDDNATIHMWDLLRNDAEPMTSDWVVNAANYKVTDMALSEENQSNARPKIALSFEDGSTQVHILSSHVSNLQPGENDQFQRFVEQL